MTTPKHWPLAVHHKSGDTVYLGPLFPAMRLAEKDNGPTDVSVRNGNWWVGNDHCWGGGSSFDEAMRFYLGATFGPTDDEYDAAALIKALLLEVKEQEVPSQHHEFTVGEVSEDSDTCTCGYPRSEEGRVHLSSCPEFDDEPVSRNRTFDTETWDYSLSDCRWWDGARGQTFDCWGRVGRVTFEDQSTEYIECEGHFNNKGPNEVWTHEDKDGA